MIMYMVIDGITKSVTEWGKISGISSGVIRSRYYAGYPIKECVFMPTQKFYNLVDADEGTVDLTFATSQEICEYLGIKKRTFYGYVSRETKLKNTLYKIWPVEDSWKVLYNCWKVQEKNRKEEEDRCFTM